MKREKSFLDRIGSLIPGYIGYQERDGQRNSDKQIRTLITGKLVEAENLIGDLMLTAISQKKTDELRRLEGLRKKINTLSAKTKYTSYGKSSFFSDEKITSAELSEIYELDLELLDSSEAILQSIINGSLDTLESTISSFSSALNNRSEFLIKYG